MKLFLEHFYIMTNDSNIDFQMNSTHNHLQKILFPITAGIILEKCFITVVLYPQVLRGVHLNKVSVSVVNVRHFAVAVVCLTFLDHKGGYFWTNKEFDIFLFDGKLAFMLKNI